MTEVSYRTILIGGARVKYEVSEHRTKIRDGSGGVLNEIVVLSWRRCRDDVRRFSGVHEVTPGGK